MAVDEYQAYHDMYGMTFREWDERVQVGDWVYFVRGVKRTWELEHKEWEPAYSLDWLILPFVKAYRRWVARGPWCAGVVRIGAVASWNSVTPRIVHFEKLASGDEPCERITELAHDLRAGRFSPTS